MKTLVCAYLGSALLAIVLTPAVIRLARRIGAMDRPGPRAAHVHPVPRIGGLAIFLSALCPIGIMLLPAGGSVRAVGPTWQWIALLGSATFIFLVGLVDDLGGLTPHCKLLAQLLAAMTVCLAGIRIDTVAVTGTLVLHLGGWGILLTLLWIVGVTNAVNFSDGLDGLAAGISIMACGVIAVCAHIAGDPVLPLLLLALAGSLSGFLLFNFHPAKVFMGDCGSLFLGFTLASSVVLCVARSGAMAGLALPALALGIPIFDTLLSMLRRRLEGRSIFAADRGHFHHRLLDLGLPHRRAVTLIYLASALVTGPGFLMLFRNDFVAVLIFACLLLTIVLLFHAVGVVHPVRAPSLVARVTGHRPRATDALQERSERHTFERFQVCVGQVRGPGEWWQTICRAAEQLELAWVSMSVLHPDGGVDVTVWRGQSVPAEVTGVVTVSLPLMDATGRTSVEFELAVLVNGSLESASRRAALFGRLIREHTCQQTLQAPAAMP